MPKKGDLCPGSAELLPAHPNPKKFPKRHSLPALDEAAGFCWAVLECPSEFPGSCSPAALQGPLIWSR